MSPKPLIKNSLCQVGAVLVGGESKRLGKNKVLAPLGGKPLIDWVILRLAKIFPKIVLLGRKQAGLEKKAEFLEDLLPGLGPISGIYSALKELAQPVFICACDMPFLNEDLIRYQVEVLDDFEAVVPMPNGLFEPLHSIYTPNCLSAIERLIKKGKKRPIEFFPEISIRKIGDDELKKVDPELLSFFNINTQEDLKKAEEWIKIHNQLKLEKI